MHIFVSNKTKLITIIKQSTGFCSKFCCVEFFYRNMIKQTKSLKIAIIAITLISIYALLTTTTYKYKCSSIIKPPLWEQSIDFNKRNYSNETGVPNGEYLVPNIVHYIRFNIPELSYIEMICILAVLKNQKPDKIMFHTNFDEFEGKYWEVLKKTKGIMDIIDFKYLPVPTHIFGQPLDPKNGYSVYHAADYAKLQVLKQYGGISLDFDTYVINNLNQFRTFEFTVNWDENQFLGCQLLIGHKDSRFLNLYLESYRNAYRADLWYYNAGERPTTEILYKQPELIHRVKVLFGVATKYIIYIFQREWDDWRAFFAVHLLTNHQYLLNDLTDKATFPVTFNEENIGYYKVTFREMAYDVYDIAGIKWSKDFKD